MAGNMERGRGRRRNHWSLAIWGVAASLLVLPAVAMQFTREVDWSAGDFIFMGLMLSAACGTYEVVTRMTSNTAYRAAVAIAIVTAFLTVWVNAAVGMLGSEDNPDNLLFGGVLVIALAGAVVAWFRPRGMAVAMGTAALAQAAMTVYALVGGYAEVVALVGLFIIPWLTSAQLFRKAARQQAVIGGTD